MKFLKWLAIVIVALIVLLLLVAVFLPGEYRVERSVIIEEPIERVYVQVADFREWEHWMPWREMEDDADYTVSDPPTGVGATMEWVGDTVGTGKITVVEETVPTMIKSKLEFIEPRESVLDQVWTFKTVPEGTEVVWAVEGDADYPVGRYFGIMMDGFIGPDFERGLQKLKAFTEGLPDKPKAREDNTDVDVNPDTVEQEPPVPVE